MAEVVLPPISPPQSREGPRSPEKPKASPKVSSKGSPGGLAGSASEPVLYNFNGKPSPKARKAKSPPSHRKEPDFRKQFLERQYAHSSIGARKNLSNLQRQLVEVTRKEADVEFWGAQGVAGFRRYLEKKFGSIMAGWRVLDKDGNGHLSFHEFCLACRRMGYHGNLKLLWSQLDVNDNKSVSLMEIDPEVGNYVATFKLALMRNYGDMLTAWRKCVDVNGDGRIQEQEIVNALKRLGLALDGKKLYGMLLSGPKGLGLTLQDFDPDAWVRSVTGDTQGLTLGANKEFLEDVEELSPEDLPDEIKKRLCGTEGGGVAKFRRQLMDAEKAAIKEENDNIGRMKAGLHTVEGFKMALAKRCGSLYGGWRYALDLDGNGRLTFGEFCQGLQRLGFFGHIRSLWKQLDSKGNGYIEFSDLDPATDALLRELRTKLKQEYGNMLLAWMKGLDLRGTGCVNEETFCKACVKAGFSGDPRRLFRVLQPDGGRAFLTLKDFDTPAYHALARADFRMLSEDGAVEGEGKNQLEKDFHDRQQQGFFYQIRRAWDAAHREEFAKACRYVVKDYVIDTMEEFEDLCKRKYGSMMGAWRQCLDSDTNGKLTFNEFCGALRRLGYQGDFNKLWKKYDKERKGYILLRDIDPDSDELVTNFLETLGERFGTLDKAWQEGFGKDLHGSIDEGELKEACKSIGFPGDAHKLFKCLQPMPGKVLISIWDLDPSCSRKKRRGDVAHLASTRLGEEVSPPTSPLTQKATMSASMSMTLPKDQTTRSLLKQVLVKKHGSTAAAWRTAFDPFVEAAGSRPQDFPSARGSVAFGRFVRVLEDCTFYGNVKGLWEELSEGRPTVTYRDMDPDGAKMLDHFRNQLISRSGTIVDAWKGGLVGDGGPIMEADFAARCQELGIAMKNPKKNFKLLLARIGQNAITLDDLKTLLISLPLEERLEVWGGEQASPRSARRESPSGRESARNSARGKKQPPSPTSRSQAQEPAEPAPTIDMPQEEAPEEEQQRMGEDEEEEVGAGRAAAARRPAEGEPSGRDPEALPPAAVDDGEEVTEGRHADEQEEAEEHEEHEEDEEAPGAAAPMMPITILAPSCEAAPAVPALQSLSAARDSEEPIPTTPVTTPRVEDSPPPQPVKRERRDSLMLNSAPVLGHAGGKERRESLSLISIPVLGHGSNNRAKETNVSNGVLELARPEKPQTPPEGMPAPVREEDEEEEAEEEEDEDAEEGNDQERTERPFGPPEAEAEGPAAEGPGKAELPDEPSSATGEQEAPAPSASAPPAAAPPEEELTAGPQQGKEGQEEEEAEEARLTAVEALLAVVKGEAEEEVDTSKSRAAEALLGALEAEPEEQKAEGTAS